MSHKRQTKGRLRVWPRAWGSAMCPALVELLSASPATAVSWLGSRQASLSVRNMQDSLLWIHYTPDKCILTKNAKNALSTLPSLEMNSNQKKSILMQKKEFVKFLPFSLSLSSWSISWEMMALCTLPDFKMLEFKSLMTILKMEFMELYRSWHHHCIYI